MTNLREELTKINKYYKSGDPELWKELKSDLYRSWGDDTLELFKKWALELLENDPPEMIDGIYRAQLKDEVRQRIEESTQIGGE